MKLQIIVGTTRPGRITPKLAKWIAQEATEFGGIEVDMVDLADYPLPFIDEPISPRYNPNRSPSPSVQKWISKVAEADAYIYVTPEYNHSFGGELKNAIDYLTFEMQYKPATVASHGSVGGARAIMQLKEVLSESKAAITPVSLAFLGLHDHIDEDGVLKEEVKQNPYGPHFALQGLLTELKWYSDALSAARATQADK